MNETDWKRKVVELEQRQQTLGADFDQLNRLSQRLCAVARGQDETLDSRLDQLQEALKQAPANRAFRAEGAKVEKELMQFFQRRDQQVRRSVEALRGLLAQVADCTPESPSADNIDQLLQSLPELLENHHAIPDVLEQTGKFCSAALDRPHTPSQAKRDSQRAPVEEDPEDERQLICRRVAVLLLELVGQLSVPPRETQRAHHLMERIEGGFDWDELEAVLQDTVDLIVAVAVFGHAEFEGYLSSINSQLADIQSFLGESRADQQQAQASSQALDEAVRNDVQQMEVSLNSAASLEQLKSSVRSQLNGIVQAMEHYRGELEAREERVEKRLVALQGKLEAMEDHAHRVQAHLEEQRLRALSDPLTLLPNRAAYDERVKQEYARWARYAGELSMVVCDMDHFKRINDTYGHLAGDKVLRIVAKLLSRGIRETDFVARYGGEEFVILLPETDTDRAKLVMDKLRQTVAASPFNFKGEPVQITMSFGISCFGPNDSAATVFERADAALYQAKGKGRNCCVVAA